MNPIVKSLLQYLNAIENEKYNFQHGFDDPRYIAASENFISAEINLSNTIDRYIDETLDKKIQEKMGKRYE